MDAAGSTTDPEHVWLVGPRDLEEALGYGHPDPSDIPGLSFTDADTIRAAGAGAVGRATADAAGSHPYWVHLDVDVLDQAAFPATDYLMPGGLELTQLGDLLMPLLTSSSLAGVSVGCYNPDKDPDGVNGEALVSLFRGALADV